VYAHDGADLRELKPSSHADMDELQAIERGDATGNYVVLPRAMVEHVTGTSTHVPGKVGRRLGSRAELLAALRAGQPELLDAQPAGRRCSPPTARRTRRPWPATTCAGSGR
jgi:hypothetical protein